MTCKLEYRSQWLFMVGDFIKDRLAKVPSTAFIDTDVKDKYPMLSNNDVTWLVEFFAKNRVVSYDTKSGILRPCRGWRRTLNFLMSDLVALGLHHR